MTVHKPVSAKKHGARTTTSTAREEVEAFRDAAATCVAKNANTKESARKFLVELGTHTPKGKLTKNYQ